MLLIIIINNNDDDKSINNYTNINYNNNAE